MLICKRTVDEAIESAPMSTKEKSWALQVCESQKNFEKFCIKIFTGIRDKELKKKKIPNNFRLLQNSIEKTFPLRAQDESPLI